jgi:hypothetical protein
MTDRRKHKTRPTTPAAAERWAVSKGTPRRGSGAAIELHQKGYVRIWLEASGLSMLRAVHLSWAESNHVWHDKTGATLAGLKTTH